MNSPQPVSPPTVGAAPWYTSQVYVSLAISIVSQAVALFPTYAHTLGLTSSDKITQLVQAIFQAIAAISGVYALVKRQNSKVQPLTMTQGSAELHPATIAAVKAGTRLTS